MNSYTNKIIKFIIVNHFKLIYVGFLFAFFEADGENDPKMAIYDHFGSFKDPY